MVNASKLRKLDRAIKQSLHKIGMDLPRFSDGRIDYSEAKEAAVLVVFVLYKDELLLLKRSHEVGSYQGRWHTVAGYLDEPTSLVDQVLREMSEELGVGQEHIQQFVLGDSHVSYENDRKWIIYPVKVQLREKPPIILDWEHTEYKWLPIHESYQMDTISRFYYPLQQLFDEPLPSPVLPYDQPPLGFFPYDPYSSQVFSRARAIILSQDHSLKVEHIGSTSVPGMPGKNSINIVVAAERSSFNEVVSHLERLQFQEHPHKTEPEDRPLRVGSFMYREKRYWLHVQLVELNSRNHDVALFFRDYLRNNPLVAAEYAALKRKLIEQGVTDRQYNAGKQGFITDIIKRAAF